MSFSKKVHAFATSSSSTMSPNNITQSCVAHRPTVSPWKPARSVDERSALAAWGASTQHEQAAQLRYDHKTNDVRSTADDVQITLSANQSDSIIASEGAPEYRTWFNWTHTCYAMQLPISSLARHSDQRACCRPLPGRSCSPKCDWHPASSPTSAKLPGTCSVIMFESPLPNRQQRLHALNSSFSCLHSLCDAAGVQHPSRKPRRDAGRLSTSPDTKHR